jgi:mRNA-degrading endonuclease toxin of MazEF toxin-antitoxin module
MACASKWTCGTAKSLFAPSRNISRSATCSAARIPPNGVSFMPMPMTGPRSRPRVRRDGSLRGMSEQLYLPDVGHLIWTDFDPTLDRTLGREQAGRRPALVLSPSVFSLNTGFAIVCPITNKVRPVPTSVVLPDGCRLQAKFFSATCAASIFARGRSSMRALPCRLRLRKRSAQSSIC